MAPGTPQIVQQSPESLAALGAAIAASLEPSLDALRQDKNDRHDVRNAVDAALAVAQSALTLATEQRARIDAQEKRMDALLGDGTGENGKLATMGNTLRKTENSVDRIEAKLDTLNTTTAELKATSAKATTFMDGWKGALMVGSVALMCISIIGGIAGAVFKLYH